MPSIRLTQVQEVLSIVSFWRAIQLPSSRRREMSLEKCLWYALSPSIIFVYHKHESILICRNRGFLKQLTMLLRMIVWQSWRQIVITHSSRRTPSEVWWWCITILPPNPPNSLLSSFIVLLLHSRYIFKPLFTIMYFRWEWDHFISLNSFNNS